MASHEPALLAAVEQVLAQSGTHLHIVLSADAALTALAGAAPPNLALLDARLPHLNLGRLLAIARAGEDQHIPVVLFSDTISEDLKEWVQEGVLDDLLPINLPPAHLALRLNLVQRARQCERELDTLRNALARSDRTDRTDRLTSAYTRDAILSLLFRETDRVQRMNTSLCCILFDIDDFGHWNTHLGTAACDHLLIQVTKRVGRLLRSYDLLGRVGKDEFLIGLPGCTSQNAVLLAERIRSEVFSAPFPASHAPIPAAIRLTACFAVAPSNGRSPIVVLREAEEALLQARNAGPETIQCAGDCSQSNAAPAAFLTASANDDLLAW